MCKERRREVLGPRQMRNDSLYKYEPTLISICQRQTRRSVEASRHKLTTKNHPRLAFASERDGWQPLLVSISCLRGAGAESDQTTSHKGSSLEVGMGQVVLGQRRMNTHHPHYLLSHIASTHPSGPSLAIVIPSPCTFLYRYRNRLFGER